MEDTVALSPRLSLVAGLGADWQATTKAQDFQKGAVIDLTASCSGDACGNTSGLNPQVGLFYALPSGLVRLTLSRKTRMPTLNNRYSYRLGTAIPNPYLDPEHSLLVEAGYHGALGPRATFQAAVFYGRITDLIQSVVISPNLSQLRNIGRVSQAGFEADVRTRLPHGVTVSANYTFLDRNNLSDPDVRLVETPRHKAAVSAAAAVLPHLSLSGFVQVEADRLAQNSAGRYMNAPVVRRGEPEGGVDDSGTARRRGVGPQPVRCRLLDRGWLPRAGAHGARRRAAAVLRWHRPGQG